MGIHKRVQSYVKLKTALFVPKTASDSKKKRLITPYTHYMHHLRISELNS